VGVSEVRREPEAGRIPEELVDRFFDRELDEGSREKFFGMLRGDLGRCAEVAKTQRMVSMLREPVEAPDLTGPILSQIRRKRGFLSGRLRAFVKAGRLAAAVVLLAGVLVLALGRRYHPEMFRLASEPQPVTQVIEASKNEAAVVVSSPVVILPRSVPAVPAVAGSDSLRTKIRLAPGKISVVPLPKGSSGALVVYGGAGPEARFVVEGGVWLDRETSARIPVASGVASGAALEDFIRSLGAECEVVPTPDAAGAASRTARP
jgi:hypothetical protein